MRSYMLVAVLAYTIGSAEGDVSPFSTDVMGLPPSVSTRVFEGQGSKEGDQKVEWHNALAPRTVSAESSFCNTTAGTTMTSTVSETITMAPTTITVTVGYASTTSTSLNATSKPATYAPLNTTANYTTIKTTSTKFHTVTATIFNTTAAASTASAATNATTALGTIAPHATTSVPGSTDIIGTVGTTTTAPAEITVIGSIYTFPNPTTTSAALANSNVSHPTAVASYLASADKHEAAGISKLSAFVAFISLVVYGGL